MSFIQRHQCLGCQNNLFSNDVEVIDTFTRRCCGMKHLLSPFTNEVFLRRDVTGVGREIFYPLKKHIKEQQIPLFIGSEKCSVHQFIMFHIRNSTVWRPIDEEINEDCLSYEEEELNDNEMDDYEDIETDEDNILINEPSVEKFYKEAYPESENNFFHNSLFTFEQLRRRYIYDSVAFSMKVHEKFITTGLSNLKEIPLEHPFKTTKELRDAHYYALNDLSNKHIQNLFQYNDTHRGSQSHTLTPTQWKSRKRALKQNIIIPMCDIVEGVPYVPLINYLVYWYSNPVLAMNTIHLKPSRTHNYIHRHDELPYYYEEFLDDTMVNHILIYSDGTSKNFKQKSGGITGFYSSLMNVSSSYVSSTDNLWLHSYGDKGSNTMNIMGAFLEDVSTLYEPFSLYNAFYSSQLDRQTYTRHVVRLSNTLFDGKDRCYFCSVYGGKSFRGNCCECEVSSDDMFLTLDQLRKLQEKVRKTKERKTPYCTFGRDDELQQELKKNQDNIYVERSIQRRNEVLDLAITVQEYQPYQEKLSKLIGGYKIERNAFLDNNFDIYKMCISERYHLLYHKCGLVRLDTDKLLATLDDSQKEEVMQKVNSISRIRYNLNDYEEWDFQKFENFVPLFLISMKDYVSNDWYKRYRACACLAILLSLPYVCKGMKSCLKTLYEQHHRAGIVMSGTGFTRKKSHEIAHAIDQKKVNGLFADCQSREKYHLKGKEQFAIHDDVFGVIRRILLKHYLTYLRLRLDPEYEDLICFKDRDGYKYVSDVQNECYLRFRLCTVNDEIQNLIFKSGKKFNVNKDFIFYGPNFNSIGLVSRIHFKDLGSNECSIFIEGTKYYYDQDDIRDGCPLLVKSSIRFRESLLNVSPARTLEVDGNVYLFTLAFVTRDDLILDTHLDVCFVCTKGGMLNLCEGCIVCCHAECVPSDSFDYEKGWYCGNCAKSGIMKKLVDRSSNGEQPPRKKVKLSRDALWDKVFSKDVNVSVSEGKELLKNLRLPLQMEDIEAVLDSNRKINVIVINSVMQLLSLTGSTQSLRTNTFDCNSCITSSLETAKRDFARLNDRSKIWLFPYLTDGHYGLGILSPSSNAIFFFDSYKDLIFEEFRTSMKRLQEFEGFPECLYDIEIRLLMNKAIQFDEVSCGVYIMFAAEAMASKIEVRELLEEFEIRFQNSTVSRTLITEYRSILSGKLKSFLTE